MDRITVSADLPKGTISRHIYGHFSEHLGHCIYGGFWVGEDSSIPNVRGIRTDVVQALRRIAVPNLRWPGGCFADEYHWLDGVGPREERPSMINTHWGGVSETNAFGTHEFMDLCDQLECEPYICGNVGSGTVREMSQWVEYLTSDAESPMTVKRKQDAQAIGSARDGSKPWRVRLWGVGNESWGCGGQMRPEYYADEYRRFATYCRNYGKNRLFRIACGANTADYHWTEVLMERAAERMDGISLHYYTVPGSWADKGSATTFTDDEWYETMRKGLRMEELVTRHSTIMDRYDPAKRVALVVDEWGTWYRVESGTNPGFLYQQNTVRDALVAGLHLNIFNNHSDRVRIANLAQTVNVLQALVLTDGPKMITTPTYHAFDLFKVHHDATLVPAEVTSGKVADIPRMNASASLSPDGHLNLTVCNFSVDSGSEVEIVVRGKRVSAANGRTVAGPKDACNTFDEPERVKPQRLDGITVTSSADSVSVKVTLPAASVSVISLD